MKHTKFHTNFRHSRSCDDDARQWGSGGRDVISGRDVIGGGDARRTRRRAAVRLDHDAAVRRISGRAVHDCVSDALIKFCLTRVVVLWVGNAQNFDDDGF